MLDKINHCACGCGLVLKKGKTYFHGHNRKKLVEYAVDPDTRCWNWLLAIKPNGYGSSSGQPAHRVYYQRFIGEIPNGLQIDHLCHNRRCVNPSHLEAVLPIVNARRKRTLRVTREIVRAILTKFTGEWGQVTSLSKEFGLSVSMVSMIVRRTSCVYE